MPNLSTKIFVHNRLFVSNIDMKYNSRSLMCTLTIMTTNHNARRNANAVLIGWLSKLRTQSFSKEIRDQAGLLQLDVYFRIAMLLEHAHEWNGVDGPL
jgi:hypothetical protein